MNEQATGVSPGSGDAGAQWQARAVDTIDGAVTAVHERVIRPLLLVSRAIVFGIIVATMALVVSILLSVAVVRLLDVYAFRGRVWAADAAVGGLLAVFGAWLWTKRRSRGNAGTS